MKSYQLIVGHDFSISNETDADIMTDYFPGIWAIKSQKEALRFAHKILADGDSLTVTDYDQPQYHALANKFIKALGLNQKLLPEPAALEQKAVPNGMPSNLAQLKRHLAIGREITIVNFDSNGVEINRRDTAVKERQTDAVIVDRNGGRSWLEFGKANGWIFDTNGATRHYMGRDGKYYPSIRIEYKN